MLLCSCHRLRDVENPAMQNGAAHHSGPCYRVGHAVQHMTPCACAGVRAATEKRWEDAARFFQIVLQQEPNSASALSNLGNVHLAEGRPEEAVRDFSRAIQLAPDVGPPPSARLAPHNESRIRLHILFKQACCCVHRRLCPI